ncbi:MAG: hypothetical protein GEU74_14490 [Nitriliruptorales bacterium]|nr:hypothetical protein [Nitriliruptorales bacterium]
MVGEVLLWLGGGLGLAMVLTASVSVFQVLVVPRGRPNWLAARIAGFVQALFHIAVKRAKTYEAKDRLLAQVGPLTLLFMLLAWLFAFHIGYSLLLWLVTGGGLWGAVREIGSSLFTLGFASRATPGVTVLDFFAAVTGLVVVALQIAYLPVLYSAFSRREVLVTTLQSRAGSPAWGPEILARHQLVDIVDNLRLFYAEWETWAAEVAESHSNYPILVLFRSPHHLRSWVLALLSVLDSAALYHAFNPDEAPSETRLCLRMGFTALRDIADVVGLPYDPDPTPEDALQLSYEDFLQGVRRLEGAGFPMSRTVEEAWPHFRGWRINYEGIAYALAERVVAPPAPWSGARTRLAGLEIEPYRPVDRRPGGDVRHIEVPPLSTE